ncbi:MAG: family 10 glycosylhydrolase [Dysgonamonadaceae bacterium]
MNKVYLFVVAFCFAVTQLFGQQIPATEVRAVWLTTNYGLDWPKNNTSVESQKRELIQILDKLQQYNFNTIFFQVRSRGEVMYKSKYEPMSSLIVGSQSTRYTFDPLAFAIDESHKRGMECHAWMVTYPLGGNKQVRSLGIKSVTKKIPGITKQYKSEWFLDPGNPKTDDYLLSLVKEIVDGYDVDGIHFDYIRYPDSGKFPDDGMFRLYGKGKSKEQWRRDNITRFLTKVNSWVRDAKPWVQVSCAPLGRYRSLNGTGRGWTAYETVYQDVNSWIQNGVVDAIYPMMYYDDQLFYPYVSDWKRIASDRIFVPGLGAYQMVELGWSKTDILDQINYSRIQDTNGQIYFRAENVLSNTKGLLNSIEELYKYPAKLPAMTWLKDTVTDVPFDLTAENVGEAFQLKWEIENPKERKTYTVYRSESDSIDLKNGENILATGLRNPQFIYQPPKDGNAYYYFISASDSYHNESEISYPAFFWHSDTIK